VHNHASPGLLFPLSASVFKHYPSDACFPGQSAHGFASGLALLPGWRRRRMISLLSHDMRCIVLNLTHFKLVTGYTKHSEFCEFRTNNKILRNILTSAPTLIAIVFIQFIVLTFESRSYVHN